MISPGAGGGGQPLVRPPVGQRLSADALSGREVPLAWATRCCISRTRRASTRELRRDYLDALGELNQMKLEEFGDPEIATRIAQYEMAFRMQSSVPELTDLSQGAREHVRTLRRDARKPGTFAANCLLARRLAERGVRFIQLFHRGWDHHGDLPKRSAASAARRPIRPPRRWCRI